MEVGVGRGRSFKNRAGNSNDHPSVHIWESVIRLNSEVLINCVLEICVELALLRSLCESNVN